MSDIPDDLGIEGAEALSEPSLSNADNQTPPTKRNWRGRRGEMDYRHTRISAVWVALSVAVLFGIALVDFIAQNTRHVRIEFFGASGRIPVAVALLAAALSGAIVVLAIGVGRVAQLRLTMRRQRRHSSNTSDVTTQRDAQLSAHEDENYERP